MKVRNKLAGNPVKYIVAAKADSDSPVAICIATIEVVLTRAIPEIDAARSALNKLERDLYGPQQPVDLDLPLSLTTINPRTVNTLEGRGICTLGQLLRQKPEDLLAIPNFWQATLRDVMRAVDELGIKQLGK